MALMTVSIGLELIEALGLPKGAVTDVKLHFPGDGIVTATVELMPGREQLDTVVSILKRYELHERPDENTAAREAGEASYCEHCFRLLQPGVECAICMALGKTVEGHR